jgi:hypothetical protein
VDLPPDFDPDFELPPPELEREELDDRDPVLFLALEDLLDEDRLDDPPDDFADPPDDFAEDDFEPELDEREELDPDLEDRADPDFDEPDLDDPDFDDPEPDDLEAADLDEPDFDDPDFDDPDFDDFDEPDLDDEDPDFEPEDFVVGIFVSSGIYRCVFLSKATRRVLQTACRREKVVEVQRSHSNLVLNSCA